MGTTRDMRVAKAFRASSGARRSPYTRWFASSSNRRRAGRASTAANPAATMESPRSERSLSSGTRPRPTTTKK